MVSMKAEKTSSLHPPGLCGSVGQLDSLCAPHSYGQTVGTFVAFVDFAVTLRGVASLLLQLFWDRQEHGSCFKRF